MSDRENRMRTALEKIAELAQSGLLEDEQSSGGQLPSGVLEGSNEFTEPRTLEATPDYGCTLKTLPVRLLESAADVATKVNPMNAPVVGPVAALGMSDVSLPQMISVLVSKYWGPQPRKLSVSFMESTPADLRARIVSHLNAWTKTGAIQFVQTTGTGEVRISRGPGGYWSYLGTDVLLIPKNRPTMNLQNFSMSTPESEFRRVIRHEAGHTLGFPHEHMRAALVARIDPQKAYAYFLATQGWDKATVDQQVLTPLSALSIFGTPADQTSIMCYQLPGSITKDGQPIKGGIDINETDFKFAGRIYPKPTAAPAPVPGTAGVQTPLQAPAEQSFAPDDWPEAEEVRV
jgi:hypothetical protein